jgi:hypothetical protein
VELKLVPIYVAVLVAALLAQSKVTIIITGGVGKNGSTVAVSELTACLHVLVGFFFLVILDHASSAVFGHVPGIMKFFFFF